MKQSVIVPDAIVEEVQRLNPGVTMSVLIRDALLIALPVWRRLEGKSAVERSLKMQLRLAEAESALEAAQRQQAQEQRPTGRGRSAQPKPAPGAAPTGPKAGGRSSGSKEATESARQAQPSPKQARSRRS